MKKVLVIAYPDLSRDPRPYRQINALKEKYEIHSLGGAPSGVEDRFYLLKKLPFLKDWFRIPMLKLGLFEKYYWDKEKLKAIELLKNEKYDLIIAHEIRLVPLALKIAGGSKVILDAHEYSPRNFDDDLLWRFFIKAYYTYLCDKYIPQVEMLFSVSQGIVDEYAKNFNIKSVLLTNACDYEEIDVQEPSGKIRMIHHGIAGKSRKLELMIETMEHLDNRFELYLMLVYTKSTKSYYNYLKRKAKKKPNIFFIDPVKRNEIISFCNQFDIGLVFLPPVNFNLQYTLPNKFFEIVQSRLAVAIGPDNEMSKYIRKHNLGIISSEWTPKSLAESLSKLTYDDLKLFKQNAHNAAKELSAENETKKFVQIVNNYLC